MALTTEILVTETSESFRSNTGLAIPAFDIVLKADGVHAPVYYGLQVENPSTGYVFLNWDSYEAHKAFVEGPSYPTLMETLKSSFGGKDGKSEMYHVRFSSTTVALDKPVTEVLVLTLKAPENRAAVVNVLTKISYASEMVTVFGQTHEDENKYVLLGGWPTVKAHQETSAEPEVTAEFDKLFSLANEVHHSHTKLAQYRRA